MVASSESSCKVLFTLFRESPVRARIKSDNVISGNWRNKDNGTACKGEFEVDFFAKKKPYEIDQKAFPKLAENVGYTKTTSSI